MKKILILLFMLMLTLTLVSCNDEKTEDKTEKEKTKELIPVDSVTVKDEDKEDFIITKDTPFYDALNCFDLTYTDNKMIEFDAKIILGDNDTANVTASLYYPNIHEFLWDVKLNESNKTFTLQEYLKEVYTDPLNHTRMVFAKYQYGLEKAFSGQELVYEDGIVTSNDLYSNYNYPMQPPAQTDFGNAHVKANYLVLFLNRFTLFQEFNDFEFNGKTIILEDYVTRSIELYEDYIIFKQTAPFAVNAYAGTNETKYAYYIGCINNELEITQTVMFNLKTQQIETVEVKGNTRSALIQINLPIEVQITAKILTLDTAKYEKVANELIEYVKENSKD